MQTFEFEVDAVDDMVKIPQEYTGLFNKHIKFIAMVDEPTSRVAAPVEAAPVLTDEYIKQHWRELLKTGLNSYDPKYYKSDQYKEERGEYLMEKYK
jgi:hypothetical protein